MVCLQPLVTAPFLSFNPPEVSENSPHFHFHFTLVAETPAVDARQDCEHLETVFHLTKEDNKTLNSVPQQNKFLLYYFQAVNLIMNVFSWMQNSISLHLNLIPL